MPKKTAANAKKTAVLTIHHLHEESRVAAEAMNEGAGVACAAGSRSWEVVTVM
ncbi:MAG: hypothetical protein AAFZ07_28320 [Actinomycetota bacterium]